MFSVIRQYNNHRIDDDSFLTSALLSLQIVFRTLTFSFGLRYHMGDDRSQHGERERRHDMYNRFTEKRRRYPCSAGTVSTLGCFLSRLSRGFSAQFDIYFQSGIRAWDYPKIAACPDSGCACYSLKSQFFSSPCRSFSPPKSMLYCKKISGRRAYSWR